MSKRKFRVSLPRISTQLHRFGSMELPGVSKLRIPLPGGIYLGGGKLILVSLSTVVLGFLAALFLLISSGDQEITWPMTGAEYVAPSKLGVRVVDPEFPTDASQTLKILLPAGIRVDRIHLKNIDLGKVGLSTAFQLSGTSTTDRIRVDTLTIKNSEFPTLAIDNATIFTFNATSSVAAAGHTFEPTMSTSTASVVISSGRGAASYVAENMVVDRILILQTTDGGQVLIGELILDGVRAWNGAADLDWLNVGTLTLENVRVGDDGDINSADLTLGTSGTVEINTIADGVVEEPIFIQ